MTATYNDEDECLQFSTGRATHPNLGIVGIGPYGDVTEGWDNSFMVPHLTEVERRELAELMIERWKKFGGLE